MQKSNKKEKKVSHTCANQNCEDEYCMYKKGMTIKTIIYTSNK